LEVTFFLFSIIFLELSTYGNRCPVHEDHPLWNAGTYIGVKEMVDDDPNHIPGCIPHV